MSGFNRAVVAALVIIVMIAAIRAIRRKDLSLSTGVIWLTGSVLALVPLTFPSVLNFVTHVIGAKYPASALTLYAFLFFALVVIIISAKLVKTTLELTRLTRTLSLLERRIRLMETEDSGDS